MNLEEMRKLDFEDEIKEIYDKYKKTIRWADQDLLNIYFNRHPGKQTFIINLIFQSVLGLYCVFAHLKGRRARGENPFRVLLEFTQGLFL